MERCWGKHGRRSIQTLARETTNFWCSACNNDGVWNDAGASLDFSIAPAWYQTLWFRSFCVICALLACYTLYLIRLQQHSARLRMRFDERLEERTRIARDLHDTLLQTIQGSKLIADVAEENTSDPVKTKSSMKTLSEWLGRAALEGRIALESLRAAEANDLEEALRLVLEDYNGASEMKSSLSVEGQGREMDPVTRDEVYRIAYEAIRNAYSHSQASHVYVELAIGENLMLRIKDDGRGVPDQTLLKGRAGHFGLKGMRERASRIGAALAISSSPKSGTTVDLVVPGKVIFLTSRRTGRNPTSRWRRLLPVLGRRERDPEDRDGSNRS